ncbi:hypothetical protein T01_1645 [Trichinella spiralis]|uniref:Uncharacterized protein n=1 Tax=Trichinella spiralis TaxID=6334 RepID=A0A0V1B933_TRISP|nr:hypothetical protein T01_1645 [Trichinella spiralis]
MQDQKYVWCITFMNTGSSPMYMNTCIQRYNLRYFCTVLCFLTSASITSLNIFSNVFKNNEFKTKCHDKYNLEVFLTVCLGILRALVAMTSAKKQISFIIFYQY